MEHFEKAWRSFLAGAQCPPVLGLAPLSDRDSEAIRAFLRASPARSWRYWLGTYPATMAVWLARKAGEAYDAGSFWAGFHEQTGLHIGTLERDEFVRAFRRACRATMSEWSPRVDQRGQRFVAELLYHAGLPLDRCRGFAQHVRKVERRQGLPELEAVDAGEQLRDAVLESLGSLPVPTLKRALGGPAGPRICEAALAVVLKGDFAGINPRLGQELEHAFEGTVRGSLRRAPLQPFVRLGADLGSLEIVGPRQDQRMVGSAGPTWIVDGRRFPTPPAEDFVFRLDGQPRVTVEVDGLTAGAQAPHTFVLRLADLGAGPFLLFDDRSRRQRRLRGPLPPGRYWLLHRVEDELVGGGEAYRWADGVHAVSVLEARPGKRLELKTLAGGAWPFETALIPFFDFTGGRLEHEGGSPILHSWSAMPFVWLPSEETQPDALSRWSVDARRGGGASVHTSLVPTGEDLDGMTKCGLSSDDFLGALPPGLHAIELILSRGERVADRTRCWYWHGMSRADDRAFYVTQAPSNLLLGQSTGFEYSAGVIRHLRDHNRQHTLTFDVQGTRQALRWPQPGVFLESVEQRPGEPALVHSHELGAAFSASVISRRSLRIWLAGERGWELWVNENRWQWDIGVGRRAFVDASLATLASSFPDGGVIRLHQAGTRRDIARFTHPLRPLHCDRVGDDISKGLRFDFSEKVAWVRPVLWDLASGNRRILEGQEFNDSGQLVFVPKGLPEIKCLNHLSDSAPGSTQDYPLIVLAPTQGWPPGLWLIELEVRRDEVSGWEPVQVEGHQRAPLVLCRVDAATSPSARARLFWQASGLAGPAQHEVDLDETGRTELLELLSDLLALSQRLSSAGRKEAAWLNEAIRSLSQTGGRIGRQRGGESLQHRLLNLACQDPTHSGFVYLPSLLALPATLFRDLPPGSPLNDALRRCGELSAADSVSEVVWNNRDLLDMSVIQSFDNFATVAGTVDGEPPELKGFGHRPYLASVLGGFRQGRAVADWSGSAALGRKHYEAALCELEKARSIATDETVHLGEANALLARAPQFRLWLQERLASRELLSEIEWRAPWADYSVADDAFLENVPRFACLFALAARSAAAGWLDFDEVLTWIEGHVWQRWMAEKGIAAMVELAPTLFGHQLLLWELIIRTAPARSND